MKKVFHYTERKCDSALCKLNGLDEPVLLSESGQCDNTESIVYTIVFANNWILAGVNNRS